MPRDCYAVKSHKGSRDGDEMKRVRLYYELLFLDPIPTSPGAMRLRARNSPALSPLVLD